MPVSFMPFVCVPRTPHRPSTRVATSGSKRGPRLDKTRATRQKSVNVGLLSHTHTSGVTSSENDSARGETEQGHDDQPPL